MTSAPDRPSVLLAALGPTADALRPEVAQYAEGPGDGIAVCDGVFSVAGSRWGRFGLLARPFVGPRLMITSYGADVPFHVENRLEQAPDGAAELRATRTFRFARRTETFVDVLRVGEQSGTLVNRLGAAQRVELTLRCEATPEGHLRLRSERAVLRLGRLRIPLPGVFSVSVQVEDGFDDDTGCQTVRALARNPLLGTVLTYRGSFRWRIRHP
ncbi:DUF4166 domain-containing protein [Microbacterium sp. JB110]|uniref:DUF4166 domain-containing protein n=1 Tax=Microbacterium sp. JB110 TaxID=2024477 RepID=UPI00097EEA8C|nr:DUF4166 domain-containing protein [Microbacterium sp. JB110]RCS62898.1 DUF4166 domain-containing protein [Microbacterium sp. JB110]SJM61651.1 hypothetical protein CZ774_10805 [Frigoribacterium sp. JB110]